MINLYQLSKDAMCCALYACKKIAAQENQHPDGTGTSGTSGTSGGQAFMALPRLPGADPEPFRTLDAIAPTPLGDIQLLMTAKVPHATAVLRPGLYRLSYVEASVKGKNGYHGEFSLQYRHAHVSRTTRFAGFQAFTDRQAAVDSYSKAAASLSHDGGSIAVDLMRLSDDDDGSVIARLSRVGQQAYGPMSTDDFQVLSEACSTKAPWMAIAHTDLQDFALFPLDSKNGLKLLSFGQELDQTQVLALPVAGDTVLECAEHLLGFDDVAKEQLLDALRRDHYTVYRGTLDKQALLQAVSDGILCPLQKEDV